MALYRLDYNGDHRTPVTDCILGGAFICRHMATARTRAIEAAANNGEPVHITRIAGAGSMKETLIVEPDGRCRRPAKSKPVAREDCKRDSGQPCFCSPCRAERKAARA